MFGESYDNLYIDRNFRTCTSALWSARSACPIFLYFYDEHEEVYWNGPKYIIEKSTKQYSFVIITIHFPSYPLIVLPGSLRSSITLCVACQVQVKSGLTPPNRPLLQFLHASLHSWTPLQLPNVAPAFAPSFSRSSYLLAPMTSLWLAIFGSIANFCLHARNNYIIKRRLHA